MPLKSDFKTFSLRVNSATLTCADLEDHNLQPPQLQYTELIGSYVSNEMPMKPPRPLHDAQKYLRRRVAEIAAQIRDSCSAHHFERHVVEIDELLRCDAPLGFTPSMILAGVPDILCILCNALLRGYLLHPADVMDETMRALTPVRMSPVPMKAVQRPLTELNETTPKKSAGNRTPSQKSGMFAIQKSAAGRSPVTLKQSTSSVKTHKLSVLSSVKEGDDADIRPFLPPLIRRSIGFVESSENVVSGSTVGGALKLTDAREQQQQQQQQQQQSQQTLESNPEGSMMHMIPRRSKSNTAATSTGNDAVALTHIALTDARQIQSKLSAAAPQQHQQQQHIRSTSVNAPPHVSLLRDIPSALQALLYHCALPLICLTAEDQRQRLTAVRALASAMASMLHVTKETMKDSADATAHSRDDTALQCMSGALDGNDSSSDDDDGVRLNLDGDSASDMNEKTNHYSGGMGVPMNLSHVSFHIRHAALDALHTLLTFIGTEEETRTNQHFSARDKRRYDMSESGNTYIHQQQLYHHHQHDDDDDDSLLQDGPSTAAHEHQSLSESNVYPARTLPLSVPNGAVAVDVLIPLLERWAALLHRRSGNNALLDSARHNSTRRDPLPMALQSHTMGPTVVEEAAAAKAAGVEDSRYKTKNPRISSNDAAELHLILRICLQLSTYRHHARALIQPQDRAHSLLHTADTPRVMSLPILLCLTMARCAEGDRCLSLCVECLWNLLEILPEETVRSILQHESEDPQQPFITTDTRATANKRVEKNKTSSYMLSSLSASECLLHTFTQILLSGHRAEQRELRNDFVVLLLLIYRHDTSVLGCEERNLRRRLFAAHGHYRNKKNKSSSSSPREQDTEEYSDDPRTALSARTLDAMSGIAMTVFDIVCGPELSLSGATECAAQRGVPAHLSRHHTVMSPATRVENLQFKLLGWRMLEAFHAWETTRNAISGLRQRLLSYAQGSPCAFIRSSSYSMKSINNNNNNNNNNNSSSSSCCGKDESVFGMFHYGLIDVLLRYVDMRCENALIVSWTREELFTLQSEAWRVLLALLGSAVDRHAANRRLPRHPRVFMKSNEAPLSSGKLSSFNKHAVVPEENRNASDVKGSQSENVHRCLSASDGRDREEIHYPNDRHLDTARCIMFEKEDEEEKEEEEDVDEEEEEGSDIDNMSKGIEADRLFVDYGGISCALSYIYSAPADAEENVCLALRVLSTLSRHPSHRRVMFATAPPIDMQNTETANVCGGITRDAEAMASPKSTLFVLVMGMMKKCIENTHAASTRRRYMKEEEKGETTRRKRQTQITEAHSKGRDDGKKIVSINAVAADSMVMSTASKSQSKGHASITFTAQGYEVLIYGLLLLHNMAEDHDNVLEIRECFMGLGGIELLLSLIRYALPSLAHRQTSNPRELLTALLNCVRVFVLESAVARRQFVLEDGVHLLLSTIGAFAAQSPTQKHKSLKGVNVGGNGDDDDEEDEFDDDDDEEGKEEIDYYDKGGNIDVDIDRTWGWGKNALPIVYALTILSDLLSESDEAREEFLSWNRPPHCDPIHNRRMHHTPTGDGDDGRMNATQLLLSLWIDDLTSHADDKEPNTPTTVVQTVAPTRNHSSAPTNAHVSPSSDRRASHRRNDAFHEDSGCTYPCQCKKTEMEEEDDDECTLCAVGSNNHCAPAVTECEEHSIPILRADRWGLAAIPGTFVSRASIINELRRRFAELSMHSEEIAAVLAAGAPAAAMGSYSLHIRHSPSASASQKTLSLTSATSPMTKQAQRRLALALCQVLGIRVKIFACLSAIGFDRLSDVRASALERIKLLHLASLPVVCRDEVWAAMAETVDFNGHAWVVPASPSDITPSEDIKHAHKSCNASGASGPNDAEDVIRPIAPDAARLIQVMLGVDARAEELRGLVSASLAAGNAHEEECTLRFLIARMRRGDDNARVATLVRLARGRHTAQTQYDIHAKANSLGTQGSSAHQSWSGVDSFIHRARQGKESKYNARPCRPQSLPNEGSVNRSRGRPPVAPLLDVFECSATDGNATIPPPRMTVMERKKKRSLMISTSKQFANRRPGKPDPLSATPTM